MSVKSRKYFKGLIAIFIIFFIVGLVITETSNNNFNINRGNKAKVVNDNAVDDINKYNDSQKDNIKECILAISVAENTEAKVHFINTGNSDSILIVQGDKSVLIDAGDNDDETLVTNYISNLGINDIEYLISTHPDADHSGGLDSVINNFNIGQFFVGNGSADTQTYTDVINAAANKGVNPSVPLEESKFQLTNNSYIQFFNTTGGSDSNESSLVTLFVNGNDKFLFTGDAGIETEDKIISKLIDVDVLKVGHHGSKYATSQYFLDKITPEYAVILTGENSYGHPNQEVLDRLKNKGIQLHRTDECGNIIFNSSGSGVFTECKEGSFTSRQESCTSNTSDNNEIVEESQLQGEFVITMQGERYHRPGCSTIKQEKDRVSRAEAEAMGYTPCGRCHP